MLSVIINITAAVILLVCLGFIAYWLVAAKQGDCEFRLLKGKKTPFKVDSMDSRRAELSCTVPIKNVGRQNGTIMDAFARPYMPQEQYDRVNVRAWIRPAPARTITGKRSSWREEKRWSSGCS